MIHEIVPIDSNKFLKDFELRCYQSILTSKYSNNEKYYVLLGGSGTHVYKIFNSIKFIMFQANI